LWLSQLNPFEEYREKYGKQKRVVLYSKEVVGMTKIETNKCTVCGGCNIYQGVPYEGTL